MRTAALNEFTYYERTIYEYDYAYTDEDTGVAYYTYDGYWTLGYYLHDNV